MWLDADFPPEDSDPDAGDSGSDVEARQLSLPVGTGSAGALPVSSGLLDHLDLVSENALPSEIGLATPVENGTLALPKNFLPL